MAGLIETISCRGNLTFLSQKCKCLLPIVFQHKQRNYSSNVQNQKHYDVIITGGGMIGTTLACALANNRRLESRSVLLLESNKKLEYIPQERYSNRVVALNQETRTLLSSLGAWKHIEAVRYSCVKKMQIWDSCSEAMITFNEDHLYDELAYIVETDLLLDAVNKQLSEKPSVNVCYNAKVKDIKLPKTDEGVAKVKLENGEEYTAKLLVGADGINSKVRATMGILHVKWQYDQMGIVATLELSEPTENTVAWQRFLPTGPIALLPLTDNQSSLVWSTTTSEAKRLLQVSEEEFVDSINDALWRIYPKDGIVEGGMKALQQLLGSLSLQTGISRQLQPSVSRIVDGSRAAFPLGFGHSVNYIGNSAVLVGDAAHRVHPLAGQGVNLGFGDIIVLVQYLAEAAGNGAHLNDINYLKKYETTRQCHNVPTMLVIDTLHRLYKGTAAPIVLARSLGLQLTNALPVLKKALIQRASGATTNQT